LSDPEFEREVHVQIARLARSMHGQRSGDIDPEDLLLEVTETAVRLLPDVHHAGVTLLDKHKKLRSTAATGPIPRILDRLQEQHQEGPYLSAIMDHHTVRVDDFASETRWPDFVAAVVNQTAVRSSLSIQLYTNESELGALNLYSERANSFTPHIEELALAIAAHAAIGLSGARRGEQIQSALASTDIIGQAKGIIMERYNITAVAAFKLFVKVSEDRNASVAEIAQLVVDKSHPANA
jgi:GAF domain-containing protein